MSMKEKRKKSILDSGVRLKGFCGFAHPRDSHLTHACAGAGRIMMCCTSTILMIRAVPFNSQTEYWPQNAHNFFCLDSLRSLLSRSNKVFNFLF